MTLNAAVIGIGNMGRNHARIYSQLKGSDLVAISDINESAGMVLSDEYGCMYYKDYSEMLKREKIDAVSVCVPTSLHYRVAKDVINSKINLLIEKPITAELQEAERLVKLAKEMNVKLAVGHVERFNPAIRMLKKIIDVGRLGKITSILARRVGLFPPNIKDSNVIIDLAVHDIDIFNYLLNRLPNSIYSRSGRGIIRGREDYAGLFLTYGSVNAMIEVNWITPVKIRALNVTGTEGYASLNYITQDLIVYKNNYEKIYDRFGDFVLKFGRPKTLHVRIKKDEPLKLELRDFLACIRNNREPVVSGADGINALKIALSSMVKP